MRSSQLFTLIVVVLLIATSPVLVGGSSKQSGNPCNGAEKKIVVDKDPTFNSHVKYTFQFSPEKNQYCVLVANKGEHKTASAFGATVDDRTAAPEMPTLQPGESKFVVKNVTEHLDVKRDNHTVTLGVFETTYVYNFTQEMNASDPDVPAPYIENVEVVRYDDNGSTALKVAVRNPTKRGYGIYVQAKSFETKSVDDIGAPQENETRVFTLPLKEASGDVVAGKVRVFDNVGEPEGKFDQKEFLAKPGNDTKAWDDEFETMPGVGDSPDYSNESARQYRDGYVDDDYLSPRNQKIGAGLTVALLFVGVLWRRRRR